MAALPFSGFETVQQEPSTHESIQRISWEEYMDPLKTIEYDDHVSIRNLEQHLQSGEANPDWLKAREGRVTGSKVSDVVGMGYDNIKAFKKKTGRSVYEKRMSWPDIQALMEWNKTSNFESALLRKLLTSTFRGNEYTKWGKDREDDCEEQFVFTHCDDQVESFAMKHYGLCIATDESWRAMSPDGVIEERFKDGSVGKHLCEWKCPWPYKGRYPNREPKFRHSTNMYGPIQVADGQWYPITLYYYCQIQWGMGLLQEQQLLYPKTMPGHCKLCGTYIDCDTNALHCCTEADMRTHREGMYCYFGVWAPKNPDRYKFGMEEKHNAFQEVSKIPFNEDFYLWMKHTAEPFWKKRYLPARYRQLYPEEFQWKARTIFDREPIFACIRQFLAKKKKQVNNTQFVDWGSGNGSMLTQALRDYETVLGFEREASFVKVQQEHTVIRDLCDSVEENVKELHRWLDPAKPTVHFVYDGGMYPTALSQSIANSILGFKEVSIVCVVLSMWPANDEDSHFEAKDWKEALKYSACREKIELCESEEVEPSMLLHLFYHKKI